MDTILKAQGMNHGTVAQRVQALSSSPSSFMRTPTPGAQCSSPISMVRSRRFARDARELQYARNARSNAPRAGLQEAGAPGGYYQQGSLDGSRPGYYTSICATPPSGRNSRCRRSPITRVSRASLADFDPTEADLPFIRSALSVLALHRRLGALLRDARRRDGRLRRQSARPARLPAIGGVPCVAPGRRHRHARQALEPRASDRHDDRGDRRQPQLRRTEIERYLGVARAGLRLHGRPPGHLAHLRESARTALGDRFDIKAFHDVVLKDGAVPLSVLDNIVNDWVAAHGALPPSPAKGGG